MRNQFINTLFSLASRDKNIILITGDLGYSVFEKFQMSFPNQFLNAGIAEQNMTGLAAGMALEGLIPIIYSVIPFVTMRNFEQIRNDICYQNANVKIVGVGAGFSYGTYAHTHHGLEDIGILRTLPNLIVVCPGDPIEVDLATKFALGHKGPVYIRLGKSGEPKIHNSAPKFNLGKGIIIKRGDKVNIITTSTFLKKGWEIIQELEKYKIHSGLISMPFIKPIDKKLIIKLQLSTQALFTLEEHSIIGGLGSAVAEILAENRSGILFKRFGVADHFTQVMGRQEYMLEANGLTTKKIIKKIIKLTKKI